MRPDRIHRCAGQRHRGAGTLPPPEMAPCWEPLDSQSYHNRLCPKDGAFLAINSYLKNSLKSVIVSELGNPILNPFWVLVPWQSAAL